MASAKKKMQKTTFIFSFITLISFLYKLGLGVLTTSMVLIIASISTLMVFICKIIFVRNLFETRQKKKKAYLIMIISILIYATLFILFAVLKVAGIDTSNNKTYSGITGGLLIGFMVVMFTLSVIGLKGSLEKTDLMVIGLKEMTFISALTDLVIIWEFVYRIVGKYATIDMTILNYVNEYFGLAIGLLMLLVLVFMLVRFVKYQTNK